jgi:hypothetical protein
VGGQGGEGGNEPDQGVAPAQCSDGSDNDQDGYIDFPADPGCGDPRDDDESNEAVLPQCNDSVDNDRDGFVDEQDPGCRSVADDNESDDPEEDPVCSNDEDDDGDGLADFPYDPGCSAAGDTTEDDPPSLPACADGNDNDGDGLTDFPDDPGCYGRGDTTEENKNLPPECADGVDNDRDGRIDYPDDDGCFAASDPSERGPCGRTYDPPRAQDGELVALDTSRGLFETSGTCGGRGSPELVVFYRLGRNVESLRISTESEITQVPTSIYVRRDACLDSDPRFELGCQREDESPAVVGQTLQIDDVKAGDYYVVVDGVAGAGGPVGLTITEVPLAECLNGLDDDEDGRIDYPGDPGCLSPYDRDETTPDMLPLCANDDDDDEDGIPDFPLDPGCQSASAEDEADRCGAGIRFTEYFPETPFVLTDTRVASGASNVLSGVCGGSATPERAFLYRNPRPARLTVSTAHPESAPGSIVYVRRTCDQRNTELGCDTGLSAGTQNGRLAFEAQVGDYWIIVDTRAGQGGEIKLTVDREEREPMPAP